MKYLFISLLFLYSSFALANDEITLFSGKGEPVSYIALTEELTIYLWSGKPVAYLSEDSAGGHHVYGFNGKHLGWFVNGVVMNHEGKASCATKSAMNSTQYETFKAFKKFKPFKAFEEFAPFRPFFTNSFGQTSCTLLLASGAAN